MAALVRTRRPRRPRTSSGWSRFSVNVAPIAARTSVRQTGGRILHSGAARDQRAAAPRPAVAAERATIPAMAGFRFLLVRPDGDPNAPAVFVSAVPNWGRRR